jgi:hypothetical protein
MKRVERIQGMNGSVPQPGSQAGGIVLTIGCNTFIPSTLLLTTSSSSGIPHSSKAKQQKKLLVVVVANTVW